MLAAARPPDADGGGCDDDDDGHEVDDDNKEENAENECKHPKWVKDTFLTNATIAKLFEIALADQEIPIYDQNKVQSILCGSKKEK